MNREPITLRNLLMRARLQDQKVCAHDVIISKGCIELNEMAILFIPCMHEIIIIFYLILIHSEH
jgi:hypothetical protein